jgi:predicted HNH restriction endonuclease
LIRRDGDRALVGHSRVSGRATIVKKPPSQPGQWAGFPGYFRIPLEGFTAFNPAPSLREIEAAHTDEIREDITPVRPEHHPYATYGEGIRIAQGLYLAALTNRMIAIFGAYAGALPDETGLAPVSIDTRQYQEGEQLRRERVFFARNPKLREDAIKHHGARCLVCEFDFEATYGAIGEGFIEIHHLEPVSARGKANATGWSTSVEDVRPLCSNCHRMVHRRSPPIPVDELAALIRLRRAQTSSEKKAAN